MFNSIGSLNYSSRPSLNSAIPMRAQFSTLCLVNPIWSIFVHKGQSNLSTYWPVVFCWLFRYSNYLSLYAYSENLNTKCFSSKFSSPSKTCLTFLLFILYQKYKHLLKLKEDIQITTHRNFSWSIFYLVKLNF